jgi:hypothetical protein
MRGADEGVELTITASERADAPWRAARDAAAVGPHLGDAWIAYRVEQGLAPRFVSVSSKSAGGGPNTELVAVGVVFLRKSRLKVWKAASATLDRLPAWTRAARERLGDGTAAADTALARAIVELAKTSNWASVELDSYDGPSPPPDLAALSFSVRERYEFLLDTSGPTETRFAALKSSHRRKVRDAEKSGVVVADETGATPLPLLRELQGHTQERREKRGEEMDLPDPESYARLEKSFVAGGGARLFVGRKEGTPLSAVLCGAHGTRAYYFMGGTSPEGFECNAATLVLWRASDLLAQRGVASFNLGGVPRSAELAGDAQHGLFRFKEGFGATRIECRSGTWTA